MVADSHSNTPFVVAFEDTDGRFDVNLAWGADAWGREGWLAKAHDVTQLWGLSHQITLNKMDEMGFKRLQAQFIWSPGFTRAFSLEMCRFAMTEAKRSKFITRSIDWFEAQVAPWLAGGAPVVAESELALPSEIEIPNFDDKIQRVVGPDGKYPWYVINDVARELDFGAANGIKRRLAPDERGVSRSDTPGGQQMVAVVSRPGLLKLCQTSDKPKAKLIDRWVRHGVMESVFETGTYTIPGMLPANSGGDADPLTLALESALAVRRQQAALQRQQDEMRQEFHQVQTSQLQLTHDVGQYTARIAEAEASAAEAQARVAQAEAEIVETRAKMEQAEAKAKEYEARVLDAQAQSHSAHAEALRATMSSIGEPGWSCLAPWAGRNGVHLSLDEAQNEGRIISAMCRAAGIEPRKIKSDRYEYQNSYPEHMLLAWLEAYRGRRGSGPTLFGG